MEEDEIPSGDSLGDIDVPDLIDVPEPFIPGAETIGVLEVEAQDLAIADEAGLELRQQQCREMDMPYHYDNDCRVCSLALEDPGIHRMYLVNNRQSQAVQQYINERYTDVQVSWNVIDNHLRNHFEPAYDAPEFKRRNFAESIKEAAKLRFQTPPEEQMAAVAEIVMQTVEDLAVKKSAIQDTETHIKIASTIATLANAHVKVIESKTKIEESKTDSEDIEAKVNQLVFERLKMITDNVSDSAQQEFMNAVDNVRRLQRASGG